MFLKSPFSFPKSLPFPQTFLSYHSPPNQGPPHNFPAMTTFLSILHSPTSWLEEIYFCTIHFLFLPQMCLTSVFGEPDTLPRPVPSLWNSWCGVGILALEAYTPPKILGTGGYSPSTSVACFSFCEGTLGTDAPCTQTTLIIGCGVHIWQ